MNINSDSITCPNCGTQVSGNIAYCPNCGEPMPVQKKVWYKNLNPAEIFLLILGSIMLLIGLVAV